MKPLILIAALALSAPQATTPTVGDWTITTVPTPSITKTIPVSEWFDVPPKEWDERQATGIMDCHATNPPGNLAECKPYYETVHRRSCEDKSRFLLMSEDGVWHCLKFEGATK